MLLPLPERFLSAPFDEEIMFASLESEMYRRGDRLVLDSVGLALLLATVHDKFHWQIHEVLGDRWDPASDGTFLISWDDWLAVKRRFDEMKIRLHPEEEAEAERLKEHFLNNPNQSFWNVTD